MRKLTVLAVLVLSIVLVSCNNSENNETDENSDTTTVENIQNTEDNTEDVSENSVVTDDFEVFWKEFQTAVATEDLQGIYACCNGDVEEFIDISGYDRVFDKEMKNQIANTQASDVEAISDEERLFQYIIEYPSDGPETFSSSFGFVIEKVNEKWLLTVPAFAG